MKKLIRAFAGLFLIAVLSGCIGEDYDFSPPAIQLESEPYEFGSEGELQIANMEWNSDKEYKKSTDDLDTFANEQEPLHYGTGQKLKIELSHRYFDDEKYDVQVWKNGKKINLPVEENMFTLPDEVGDYVISVTLSAEDGTIESVGSLILNEREEDPGSASPVVSLQDHSKEKNKAELTIYEALWHTDDPNQQSKNEEKIKAPTMTPERQKHIVEYAKEQKALQYSSGQKMDIRISPGKFSSSSMKAHAIPMTGKMESTELPIEKDTIKMPDKPDKYALIIELVADHGYVTYFGDIDIK